MALKTTKCRLCGSDQLHTVFSLGEQLINDFPATFTKEIVSVPIELINCSDCGMLQAGYTAPNKLLYSRKYWFKSGTNPAIKKNLKEIAFIASSYLADGDTIIDVGANDGTLLSYIPPIFNRVGIEPAINLTDSLRQWCDDWVVDFWQGYHTKAKVITAIGMFYDMEMPIKFLMDIKKTLKEDGVFITELMTAATMQDSNDIGTLCHEHLMHFTWTTFKDLFKRCGLEIFKIELNPQTEDGKGYRIFARHWKEGHVDFEEPVLDLKTFYDRVCENRDKLVSFIKEKKKEGKKVYIYGASTKGNVLIQFYNLGPNEIDGAIDKDPDKIGKFMLTGIPIVDEQHIKLADYLWCIPYSFLERFMQKEKDFKGQWIVSMPEFSVHSWATTTTSK